MLGVITNDDGRGGALFPTFDGVASGKMDLLVKYTYLGDTDFNGRVDGNDVASLLTGMSGGLHGWINGDVNYDGAVTGADLTLLLAGLQGQGAPLGGPGGDGGAVPEPSVLGAVLAGTTVAARRRRR